MKKRKVGKPSHGRVYELDPETRVVREYTRMVGVPLVSLREGMESGGHS